MDRLTRDRLKWKCRRGLLELDLVLERFMANRVDGLDEADLARLNALLELPDNDLWDIVSGRSNSFEDDARDVVIQLRGV